jgi:tRNA-dihydrouridine synthase
MLKRKQKLADIFYALNDWRESNKLGLNIDSIGIKIRLGLNASEVSSKVYMNVVDIANKAGLDYIVVHGRHGGQRSSDRSDWSAIREIKGVADMPVIGNGDVMSCVDALRMMNETHCDGVMIARGAMRNPWIFKQLKHVDSESSAMLDEYWPTLAELTDVENLYFAWIAQHPPTNRKCLDFHTQNFRRIRRSIERQDFTGKWLNPSKVYI